MALCRVRAPSTPPPRRPRTSGGGQQRERFRPSEVRAKIFHSDAGCSWFEKRQNKLCTFFSFYLFFSLSSTTSLGHNRREMRTSPCMGTALCSGLYPLGVPRCVHVTLVLTGNCLPRLPVRCAWHGVHTCAIDPHALKQQVQPVTDDCSQSNNLMQPPTPAACRLARRCIDSSKLDRNDGVSRELDDEPSIL